MSKKNRAQRKGLVPIESSVMQSVHYEPLLAPRQRARTRSQMIQWMLERKIMELCMNRFEWKGLPPEISKRNLEMALMYNALAVIHYDDKFQKYMAHYGAPAGNLNMQNDPTEYIAYGNGVYPTQRLNIEKCVPVWANYMRMPDIDLIRIYSSRLADMDRTIEINAKNSRQSKVLVANENSRLSALQMNQQFESGNNTIAVDPEFGSIEEMFTVLDLGIDPVGIINMSILRGRVWNELMTMLGINNANQDKKERLVAAEVSGNDDMVEAIRATQLNARQEACELLKERYKLTVTVEYVTDMNQTELKDTGSGDSQNKELDK